MSRTLWVLHNFGAPLCAACYCVVFAQNGLHLWLMLLRLTLLHRDATTTVLALFPFLRLTFSLLCMFGRMWTMAKLLLVRRYLHNVRSQSISTSGCCMRRRCGIRLRNACVMCTCLIDENSAMRGNIPQRNDEEGGKQPRLSFSPAASVWGPMGRAWTTDGRNAPRTTESNTEKDYVAFFHQFFGLTNNPALAPFANVPCRCQRYFKTCVVKVSGTTSTPASIMLRIGPVRTTMPCGRWRASAGFATNHKQVLTSEVQGQPLRRSRNPQHRGAADRFTCGRHLAP